MSAPRVLAVRSGIVVAEVPSSRGRDVYLVHCVDCVARCSCRGFAVHGHCKHAAAVAMLAAEIGDREHQQRLARAALAVDAAVAS